MFFALYLNRMSCLPYVVFPTWASNTVDPWYSKPQRILYGVHKLTYVFRRVGGGGGRNTVLPYALLRSLQKWFGSYLVSWKIFFPGMYVFLENPRDSILFFSPYWPPITAVKLCITSSWTVNKQFHSNESHVKRVWAVLHLFILLREFLHPIFHHALTGLVTFHKLIWFYSLLCISLWHLICFVYRPRQWPGIFSIGFGCSPATQFPRQKGYGHNHSCPRHI